MELSLCERGVFAQNKSSGIPRSPRYDDPFRLTVSAISRQLQVSVPFREQRADNRPCKAYLAELASAGGLKLANGLCIEADADDEQEWTSVDLTNWNSPNLPMEQDLGSPLGRGW
jgi:hypothetical protein